MDLAQLAIRADSSDLVRAKRDLDALPASSKRAESATSSLTKSYSSLGVVATRLIGVLGAAGLGKSLIGLVDNYTKLTAQIKNATTTQNEYNQAFSDIQRIAKVAQADLGAVSALYSRLNLALKDSGTSLKDVGRITESVALTLKAAGASAGETSSVMLQLSQAFGAGALRSEEFNAVAENAPSILRALATSLGVQVGALKSMAAEGQLTNTVLKEVLGSDAYLETVRNQAKEMQTVSGAFTQLMNDITLAVGQADNVTEASTNIANGIGLISKQIVSLINFITENRQTIGVLLEIYGIAKGARAGAALGGAVGFPQVGAVLGGGATLLGIEVIKDEISSVNRELTRTEELTGRISRSQNAIKNLLTSPLRRNETLATRTEQVQKYVSTISKYQIELDNLTAEMPKIATTNIVTEDQLKEARRAAEKIRKEKLDEIKFQIDFEQDIKETRDKAELKAIEDIKEAKLKADKEVADAREKYIAIEQQRANDNFKEAQEAYRNQVSNYEKIFDRANENLSRALTDSIVRGFENGEKFITNFKNAITNAFKGYFVNIGVNFVQEQLSDLFGGIGKSIFGAFSGGQASFVDGIMQDKKTGFGGVLSDLGSIFTKSNQSIIGGIESVGASIANGMGGIRDTIGGYLGTNASFVANAASYAGAVLQLAQGNWAGAAGTAIGTALGGPVGGAIGSFLGNAVGGLFGGKDIPMTGDQAKTRYSAGNITTKTNTFGKSSLGGGGALAQANEAFAKTYGALITQFDANAKFTIDTIYRSRTNTQGFFRFNGKGFMDVGGKGISLETFIKDVLGNGLAKVIQQSTAIPKAFRDLFTGLKKPEAVEQVVLNVIKLNENAAQLKSTLGITAEQVALLARESGIAGDNLTLLVNTVTGVSSQLFTIGDALVKVKAGIDGAFTSLSDSQLPANLKAFDEAIKTLDKTTAQGRQDFLGLIQLREQFAQFEAAIGGLKTGVKGALFGIVSDAERQQIMNQDLAAMFSELNMTVPASIQELIALGKSIDYTTAEGLNLASVFPTLVNAFNTTKGAVDGLINSLTSSRFETFADFAIGSSLARQGVGLNQIPVRGASQGTDNQVAVLLTRLIAEVSEMKESTQQTADNTLRTTRELEDIAGGNVTLSTQAA